jgi:hypothetical protein
MVDVTAADRDGPATPARIVVRRRGVVTRNHGRHRVVSRLDAPGGGARVREVEIRWMT